MTRARSLGITLVFAALYVGTAWLGRQTIVPGTAFAMVWPAAGVAAVWFASTGWRRSLAVDAVALLAAAGLANASTGASPTLAAGLAWAAVLQVLVFGVLVSRWMPHLWGPRDGLSDDRPGPDGLPSLPGELTRLVDVARLVAATLISTAVSGLLGPAFFLSVTSTDWVTLSSWVARNSVGLVAVFPLGMALVARLRRRGSGASVPRRRTHPAATRGELAALVAATALSIWAVFVLNDGLPLPFFVLATSIWVGTRFGPAMASAHSIAVGGTVVVLTIDGQGPIAEVAPPTAEAAVIQAFVALTVAVALALSVGREESARLNGRLEVAERDASGQAAMLTTILDSLADVVVVMDADGEFVVRNPASDRLISPDVRTRADLVRDGRFGAFHPDGSRLRVDELPSVRALAGERVQNVDLVFRSEEFPEGRLVEASASLLPGTEDPLAVVVFHDVTADRRERDELASFAGVVAHDLLNPLTTVEGWSEALLDEIRAPEELDRDLAEAHLSRVQRAARRMRDLINDLLAYTTARDMKLNPVPVDLSSVAHEAARAVVERRTGDGVQPAIEVGPMPAVLAEPVLLRQVIDNLIGNSVKYVAPGVRPEIDIRSCPEPDGMVAIEISDNGIGIPQGQHAKVFDSFHRAHTNGYRGTGLGLSIVKRIVERHGGTIVAMDNPRHPGTTMRLTFPAAPSD